MEASRKPDRDKIIKAFRTRIISDSEEFNTVEIPVGEAVQILELLKEQEKEIKALHLLVEWAEECDFGFDQFPDEYERYKDEIKGMKYIDGMIHIAKRTLEDHGAFEEGR